MTSNELAWNLYAELRKEILSTQQLRARAIEFKITFVSTAIGLIVANLRSLDPRLLILPAFAAIFFDLLIISYSFAIKRKGAYARTCLEPLLREYTGWPEKTLLWEEFMSKGAQRQLLSFIANIGITILSALPGVFFLLRPPQTVINILLIAIFGMLLIYAITTHGKLTKFVNRQGPDDGPPKN
jgi:hypothetical protein